MILKYRGVMTLKEVREMVFRGQLGYCYGSGCLEKAVELHHRVANTKPNKKFFPLFIDSPFNLVGLCKKCHEHYKEHNITPDMAIVYEEYLRRVR